MERLGMVPSYAHWTRQSLRERIADLVDSTGLTREQLDDYDMKGQLTARQLNALVEIESLEWLIEKE